MSSTWKRDFASGLIVLLPIIVTLYILAYLYGIVASAPFLDFIGSDLEALLASVVAEAYVTPRVVTFVRVLLTLVVFVLLVFSVGYLMRTALGNFIEDGLDDVMNRLPGLRVVYNASKMAVETALSGTDDLQSPVKVETWNGMRMTAFKTGQTAPDGRDVLFLPTAPNITTGFVVEVEEDAYEEIDESVEDALTRILSAGFGESNDATVAIGDVIGEKDDEDD
ncbi:DUF502 domain-containing protein [Halapricum sp. CBA1109]|jgi:uncharacterized membrane protein|uniref:DUF502 domain-containing protein n=1 Tax=Halapricum sp. CBA1109 TaxID=2668068 RepID=UPI0012F7BE0E|nr:DUF502 domain-containing protein [Halapricum sp. CBA1109]MUV90162.1 DUF502 domain-containing protein [Halapricum sp. CBA1109]